eukprot:SAG25_NODE_3782_length_972_cov_1.446735_1_plen_244_part_00
MYDQASAVIRVRKNDGTDTFSTPFPIKRGVVQGAIDSPWYFVRALECIFRQCDTEGGINLNLPCGNIMRLEYADDAALLCANHREASLRLTRIAIVSTQLADMQGSRPKTESMTSRKPPRLPLPTEPQIRDTLGKRAEICPHCERAYSTSHGLKTHLTHGKDGCRWKHCCTDQHISSIVDIRGGGDYPRFFAVPDTARTTRSGRAVTNTWIPEPILRQHPGGPEAIAAFYESYRRLTMRHLPF